VNRSRTGDGEDADPFSGVDLVGPHLIGAGVDEGLLDKINPRVNINLEVK